MDCVIIFAVGEEGVRNQMKKITVYTTDYCPYCRMAKALLDQKGLSYEEILLKTDEEKMQLVSRTKHRTVPQIFFGETFIGGFDDLNRLAQEKDLQELLK